MTVWIYVDTARDVGDADHLKVFATEATADAWFSTVAFVEVIISFACKGERNQRHPRAGAGEAISADQRELGLAGALATSSRVHRCNRLRGRQQTCACDRHDGGA
jgi:hypothetical protein